MRTQSNAGQVAGLPSPDLELVNYGAGWAWLRAELDVAIADAEQLDQDLTRRLGRPEPQPEPEDVRYTIDCGATSVAHSRGQVGCLHEPGCDGTGPHHGRHDCTKSGEPGAGCFATCEACA